MNEKTKHKIFVYGTLRPKDDEGNFLPATHRLYGYIMYNYFDKFPFVVETDRYNDEMYVVGNIIEVDDKQLAQLDRYEGVDRDLYSRNRAMAYANEADDSTTPEIVYVYVGTGIQIPMVTNGDWADVA